MSDDNQIHIPPSFFALYTDARQRLTEPMATIRVRYEICEDLANHLVGHAQVLNHVEVPDENEILGRIHAGLTTPEAGVSAAESRWIVRRLAELLGWSGGRDEAPADDLDPAPRGRQH
ncbi:hypothetical protein [Variovorax sp. KK3]|uniref:hypothetical protein n=1 Tax=Variovorax sp. KK3 TaxID=1855728 RepID=UPI00097C8A94|nr:hypothetical protein [Variovorax sp. KK3]